MREVLGDSGPAVLLLPGGAEAVDGFYPGLIEALMAEPDCRVVLYDRPGTVGSGVEGGLAGATEAIHDTLAELAVGPVVVIGQSLGGAIGLLLARDHPEDVSGLVLLDPTPVNDVELARQVEQTARITGQLSTVPGIGWTLAALVRSSANRSARRHEMTPESREAMLKMAEVDLPGLAQSAAGLEALAQEFDESQLPAVPAAVLTADRKPDSAIRRAHQRIATALDTPLLCFPGAEHAVHLTHPDQVLEASRAVVRTVAATQV
jgi:pimeloyl-ACP methyl ester carboxylesterase